MTVTTRFRYFTDDDIMYMGEAQIEQGFDNVDAVNITECWRLGMELEEVFPHSREFPGTLRMLLIQAAIESLQTPPATPVELPSDWNGIEVVDVENLYTINARLVALPVVGTDVDARTLGLSAIRRIMPIGEQQYRIIAKGGIEDVRRELHRVRLF